MAELSLGRQGDPVIELTRRVDKMSSIIAIAGEETARLTTDVSLAKGRLDYQEEVTQFMEQIQDQLHEKTVGRYEKLLTAILRDVFPDEEDKIVIEISTKRNMTAINFSIETASGHKEDVMDGRGGSIANVLSIGLRFISLSQTNLRQFMVLDEADCWLSPARIPAVGKVIHMLAEQIGVQTLLISHHDPKAFESHALMVQLMKQGDTVVAEPNAQPQWDADDKGIRGIYLHNVMSHENTFIPLSKGVTALIGDNDIGKSAVVTALRALLYGEGGENLIRHGSEKATVTLDLGLEGMLSYERFRKGAKKTRYALMTPDSREPAHESIEASVPDWLVDLGFGLAEDLDIQLGHQKRPVFLLNEPDTKRASILSVGKEASWMTAMRKQYKGDVKIDKDIIKQGERRIQQLSPKIKLADRAELAEDRMEELADSQKKIVSLNVEMEKRRETMMTLEAYKGITQLSEVEVSQLPEFLEVATLPKYIQSATQFTKIKAQSPVALLPACELLETVTLTGLISSLKSDQKALLPVGLPAVLPEFENTEAVTTMGRKMMAIRKPLKRSILIADDMGAPATIDTLPVADLERILTQLVDSKKAMAALEKEATELQKNMHELNVEQDALIDANGGMCPLCEHTWTGAHTHD